jgi:hypothetical protein
MPGPQSGYRFSAIQSQVFAGAVGLLLAGASLCAVRYWVCRQSSDTRLKKNAQISSHNDEKIQQHYSLNYQ